MSKRKQYKPKPKSSPMLVNRYVHDTTEGKDELAMLHAFQFGNATRKDYDYLIRMANMLNIASHAKGEIPKDNINAINFLLKLILERYQRTGKFGLNSDEISALRNVVVFYNDYWRRQVTYFYNDCIHELNAFYDRLNKEREAA